MKVGGMLHDSVVRKKRRVKKGNKYVRVKPVYEKLSKRKLPDDRVLKTKGGTQMIDGAWRFIKEHLRRNQNAKVSSSQLAPQIRSAQYEYLRRNGDLWIYTGQLIEEYMQGFVREPES